MATYKGFQGDTPHKAREAYARSLGYSGYRSMRQARAEHRPRARDVYARPTTRATETQAGRVAKVSTGAALRSEVEAAAAAGVRVSLIATFDTGAGPRTHRIDKWTGAAEPAGHVRKGEGGVSSGDAQRVAGSVQVVSGPAVSAGGGGGIDPNDLLDFFDMYDDIFDALFDMWDEEYP